MRVLPLALAPVLYLGLMASLSAAERQVVFPGSAKPIGPYSPGIFAGDYLYVSGQGARDSKGNLPATIEDQTRQCLENVKTIVEAAGLTMDHVVYTHTYLLDMNNYAAMNKVYATYFPGVLPARSTMGVANTPGDTPVEILAVAVRDLTTKHAVTLPNAQSPVPISPGILTTDRFYISGILGRDAEHNVTPETGPEQIRMCLDRLARVLKAAAIPSANIVHLNVYRTADLKGGLESAVHDQFPDSPISFLEVASLPFGVKVGITGLAVRDAKQKRVYRTNGKTICASAGSTVYCAAQSGANVQEAAQQIEAGLKAMGTGLGKAVANNVYLNDIADFATMNAGYAKLFPDPPPTRTTVQPAHTGAPAVQLSVIAIR
jgi:2-iminobutanoate/2-iminopropanoate deaminase